jgi:hypothetical protein
MQAQCLFGLITVAVLYFGVGILVTAASGLA